MNQETVNKANNLLAFETENKECLVKKFKNQFCPDYKDFGSMGDL